MLAQSKMKCDRNDIQLSSSNAMANSNDGMRHLFLLLIYQVKKISRVVEPTGFKTLIEHSSLAASDSRSFPITSSFATPDCPWFQISAIQIARMRKLHGAVLCSISSHSGSYISYSANQFICTMTEDAGECLLWGSHLRVHQ